MKALFGSLLSLVLATAHTYALKGGPPYPGGQVNIVGRYAGVLRPSFCPFPNPVQCGGSLNALGIFSLPVPQTGISNGTVLIFSTGRAFVGSVTGLGDPGRGSITGVLNAAYQTTIRTTNANGTIIETLITAATASGSLQANVVTPGGLSFGISSTRLRGSAIVTIANLNVNGTSGSVGEPISFDVDGFKQSNSAN